MEAFQLETEHELTSLDFYVAGIKLLDSNERNLALFAFEQAIRKDPEFGSAYLRKGAVLGHLGRIEESRDALETSLELGESHFLIHHAVGLANERLGNLELAVDSFQNVLKHPDTDQDLLSRTYFKIGIILDGLGRPNEAIPCYKKSLETSPYLVGPADARYNISLKQQQTETPHKSTSTGTKRQKAKLFLV